jgi:ankyrin repeat, SAM and basic leucine zipper domain-containing protein 1
MIGKYRPAEEFSEDEDDYEGFSFAPQPVRLNFSQNNAGFLMSRFDPQRIRDHTHEIAQFQQMQAKILGSENIVKAIQCGNLEELQTLLHKDSTFAIHDVLSQGWTLLMYACKSARLNIVEYLLARNVDVNMAVEALTPLMLTCQCNENRPNDVLKIVKCLMKHGAVLNICDQYGVTPFMFACAAGHLDVVKLMLPLVTLEAVDNMGCTAIFHAIENNRLMIVELLLNAGALTSVHNNKGYKPKQVAEFYGFQDIVNLFPEEVVEYCVPENWMTYSTFYDLLPGLSGNINEM